ncbi:MAG: DUF928 domain-containing protein [Cyanophyceae cyanobacterium]
MPTPKSETYISVEFPSLPDEEAAENTAGGGRRGDCTGDRVPLTVLMPPDGVVTTLASNPTIYWFIPESTATTAEFIIVDAEGNDVYTNTIEPPASSGLVKLQLPESVALNYGESYEWQLTLFCSTQTAERELITGSESITGKLQRIQLTEEQQAELAAIANQSESAPQLIAAAERYAEYGLWQEALTTLEQLRQSDPDLGMQEWTELLNSVGIEAPEIVEATVVGAVEPGTP